jgi:hypothetical protein
MLILSAQLTLKERSDPPPPPLCLKFLKRFSVMKRLVQLCKAKYEYWKNSLRE